MKSKQSTFLPLWIRVVDQPKIRYGIESLALLSVSTEHSTAMPSIAIKLIKLHVNFFSFTPDLSLLFAKSFLPVTMHLWLWLNWLVRPPKNASLTQSQRLVRAISRSPHNVKLCQCQGMRLGQHTGSPPWIYGC